MYNNAINSCIEDLKTEILSFMPVSYFFMLPLASGLMKGSRLALIEHQRYFQLFTDLGSQPFYTHEKTLIGRLQPCGLSISNH